MQHLFDDTVEWLHHISTHGCTIDCVIGKHYSTSPSARDKLHTIGIIPGEVGAQDTIRQQEYLLSTLVDSLTKAKANGQKTVLHEVGGYFADVLARVPPDLLPYFAGIVEDTTYGHRRYESRDLPVPVFSVARSVLKEVEARFVGEAVVTAFSLIMRNVGLTLRGRSALVLGYGMIGKIVTSELRKRGVHTAVYDTDGVALLHAYFDGHTALADKSKLDSFDAVFGVVGGQALNIDEMRTLKDGVVLASAGSKDVEFDVQRLAQQGTVVGTPSTDIHIYQLDGKQIVLLCEGTPINFRIESVPSEVIDLVYAEILTSIIHLLTEEYAPGMHTVAHGTLSDLASRWLEKARL